ncbi:MAG TPA: SBBP repeat-containing protein, partial [Acidobacteriota bacterium]|nr:SBBP repeat-containing protein [Acidobacteriota bacterium]
MKKILYWWLFCGLLSSVVSQPSSVIGHRSSVISHRSSVIGHQSSVIGHQSSVIGHRSSVISHRSSVIGHQSAVMDQRSVDRGHSPQTQANQVTQARVRELCANLPLSFEANQGQAARQVKYLSRGKGYTLFLTSNEVMLAVTGARRNRDARQPKNLGVEIAASPRRLATSSASIRSVLRMKLIGANPFSDVVGLEQLPSRSNYFIGNDVEKWHTDVPNYARVLYRNVYPGINLAYYGNQRLLENDFILSPGADPSAIKFEFQGADRLSLDADGNLILQTPAGHVVLQAPLVYQDIDGDRREVIGRYRLESKHRVALNVGEYDRTRVLTIDPKFTYSTYLGGNLSDIGTAIALDGSGNFYVTGQTASASLFSQNSFKPFSGGDSDAFVVKFNSNLSVVYSTYLGGSGADSAGSIAVDSAGNVYITGQTDSANFPTMNPIQPALRGGKDGFITKLDATGRALVYSTYLGGSQDDLAAGIAIDSAGNAYVTGQTASNNLFQQSSIKPFSGGSSDAFVAKLDSLGRALVYSTYLGGSGQEAGIRIAVDINGNAYVTGVTDSRNFPVQSAFQATYGGGDGDGFVAKLNPSGSALVYSTYLGGSGLDGSVGLAVDKDGSAYVTGGTNSTNFPKEKALRPAFGGGVQFGDGFLAKLSPSGSSLIYSTYLGGSGDDAATAVAIDSDGNAYVTGFTMSTNFPLQDPIKSTFGGGSQTGDAFVVKLNRDGSALVFSTYLGGSGDDAGFGIAVDTTGAAYVTGLTSSPDFPKEKPLQSTYGGGDFDAFITKIAEVLPSALNFPVLRSTADTFTGLAFLNLGKDPVTLTPKAYGETGGELSGPGNNPVSRLLPGSQQLALLAPQLFNFTSPNTEGWIQVQTDKNTVVGFELIGQVVGGDINALDGVDVQLSPSPVLVLTDIEYDSIYTTEVHVVNVTNFQNNVALELYGTSGNQVGKFPTSLGPRGKFFRKIQDIFPSVQQPFLGYLVVRGDQNLAALELLVSKSALAALNGQKLQTGSSTPTKLYSAQLGNRRSFLFTRLNLVNPTPQVANLVARAIGDDGSNLGSPVAVTLGPGKQDRRDVGQMFGLDPNKTTSGSLVIESTVTGIIGDVSFGDDSGANAFRASLPLDSQPSKFAAFAHVATAGAFLTGLAAFNPNPQAANTSVKVFRPDGSLVGATSPKIDPNGRFSKLLFPELVIASGNQAGGFFTLESDQPISSFALFGTVSGGTFTALSAIPPQRLETTTADNPAPALKADYQFQNSRASSISGPPALTDLGSNSFGTVTVDGSPRTVLRFAANNGLSVSPTGGVIPNNTYSVVVLFAFDVVSGFRRIVDFKNGASDTGLYNLDGNLNFYNVTGGSGAPISANVFVQTVLTRDAAKKVTGYVNGVQQFSFTDSSDLGLIDSNNVLRFFQDNTSGGTTGEASAGSVARIRLYDSALSASEVAALDRLPSGAGTFPIPAIASLSPSSATAGGPAFTLTVNGSNFVNSSVVQWNGSSRITTFISSSQLSAAINAADIAVVGGASVTVFNPLPGGGTSNAQTFTIISGGTSGTAPTIKNVTATVLTEDSVKLDIQLSDPDGDIVKLEFTWSRIGIAQQSTRVLNSPGDINLAGLTSGTVTYTFTGIGFLTPFGTLAPDRVDVQATDAKGLK